MSRLIYIAWLQSVVAVIGSLVFDKVVGIPPCELCWYQRMCMFPLAVIFTVGILRENKDIYYYVLPFSIVGLLVAVYHNLLYYGILSQEIFACSVDVSCVDRSFEVFGFLSIPLLSLLAFVVINLAVVVEFSCGRKLTTVVLGEA